MKIDSFGSRGRVIDVFDLVSRGLPPYSESLLATLLIARHMWREIYGDSHLLARNIAIEIFSDLYLHVKKRQLGCLINAKDDCLLMRNGETQNIKIDITLDLLSLKSDFILE